VKSCCTREGKRRLRWRRAAWIVAVVVGALGLAALAGERATVPRPAASAR